MKLISYQIIAVSISVWREATRDRGIYTLILSGLFLLLASQMLGVMAVINAKRIIQTMGMWVLGIGGLVSIYYLGANFINAIHNQSIIMVLCRPVSRSTIILGRYLGMVLTLTTIAVVLFSAWLLLLGANTISITQSHLCAILFIYLEWLLLSSISLMFATFTNTILHSIFITMFMIFGHLNRDIYVFSENTDHFFLKWLLKSLYYCLPNLELINFRKAALYGASVSGDLLLQGGTLVLLWSMVFLFAACLIFHFKKIA